MDSGIVVEDPKYAHIPRPPSGNIWWRCWRSEPAAGVFTTVAVNARTWFAARACARVLLGTDVIDGEELPGLAPAASTSFFIGPHDVVFFDLMPSASDALAREHFCTRRAELVDGEFREVAEQSSTDATGENERSEAEVDASVSEEP